MADTATAEPVAFPKKPRNGRKALKEKNASVATDLPPTSACPIPSPMSKDDPTKENHESLSEPKKGKSGAAASKKQQQAKQSTASSASSFEKELLEMQEMLQQLKIEKEKTEELLKEKDEMLKMKEEELETRGKKQEKLQVELKKLQKLKEFKPTMVSLLLDLISLMILD